jgi:hypothetical protein
MTRKQYLLSTTMPHAMAPEQTQALRKLLAVTVLAWDGVLKAMRKARETVTYGLR